MEIRASIVVSIPACHAGDRSSILRLGVFDFVFIFYFFDIKFFGINKYFYYIFIYIFIYIYKFLFSKNYKIISIFNLKIGFYNAASKTFYFYNPIY